jgi:hypothetical protein
VKVEELIVAAFMAKLKVAVMAVFTATSVVPLAGVTAVTVGAVGGGGGADVPELDPPHPETTSAADTSRQATPKRMMRFLLGLPLGFAIGGENGRLNSQPRMST